jgi:hypothetical protein
MMVERCSSIERATIERCILKCRENADKQLRRRLGMEHLGFPIPVSADAWSDAETSRRAHLDDVESIRALASAQEPAQPAQGEAAVKHSSEWLKQHPDHDVVGLTDKETQK